MSNWTEICGDLKKAEDDVCQEAYIAEEFLHRIGDKIAVALAARLRYCAGIEELYVGDVSTYEFNGAAEAAKEADDAIEALHKMIMTLKTARGMQK